MTLSSFPPQLHYEPEQNTLKYDPNTGSARTAMDQGPTMARVRFTGQPVIQTFVWRFTPIEFEIFKSYHKYDLANGTKWFYMMVWSGSAYGVSMVQFMEDYQGEAVDTEDMRVSAKIQIRSIQELDAGAAWLIGTYGATWVIEVSDLLQKIVNVDMPAAFINL
jgi:hypothetical protein